MDAVLPKRMKFKHGAYYYVRNNNWTWLSRDFAKAVATYRGVLSEEPKYTARAYDRAVKNAKHRQIDFLLTRDEFWAIVSRAKNRCEVTGIRFNLSPVESSKRRPWAPSLDRIDSRLPYTFSNCRLVCVATNAAMSDWGEQVLFKLASALRPKTGTLKTEDTRETASA